jgi:glyoxylase-like metal-dependent hydrolase (beta-lactamase superfamily II)/rhodanese-related sulfurtransferase
MPSGRGLRAGHEGLRSSETAVSWERAEVWRELMSNSPGIDEITPDELYRDIRRGNRPFILDVRNADEFATWSIEGLPARSLVNIPYFQFLEDEPGCLERIPRERNITVVCAKGGSSAFVASILTQHGVRARNLRGGMIAWGDLHVTSRVASVPESSLTLMQINRVGKRCLSYVIVSDGEALVIDPARYTDWYTSLAQKMRSHVSRVIDTHLHADHLSGGPALTSTSGIPYHIRLDDAVGARFPYHSLEDGAHLALGSSVVEVIALHTPGHTPGSTSLLVNDRYLLTGDTLFVKSIGRPDLGDKAEEWALLLYHTLFDRIARLSDDVLILPAHYSDVTEMQATGIVATTLGEARQRNRVFQHRTEAQFLEYVLQRLPAQPPIYQEIRRANLGRIVLDAERAIEAELGPNQCAAVC